MVKSKDFNIRVGSNNLGWSRDTNPSCPLHLLPMLVFLGLFASKERASRNAIAHCLFTLLYSVINMLMWAPASTRTGEREPQAKYELGYIRNKIDSAQYAGSVHRSRTGSTERPGGSAPTTDRQQEKILMSAVQLAASLNSLAIATTTPAAVPSTSSPVSRPFSKRAGTSFEPCFNKLHL